MHQHGGFGVPVGLRPDVYPVNQEIDFPSRLSEVDQPPQDASNPIHVFNAAVHRDFGASRDREPLQRNIHLFGQIDSRHNPATLGLSECPQILAGIAKENDAFHAFGIFVSKIPDDSENDVGLILPVRTMDAD